MFAGTSTRRWSGTQPTLVKTVGVVLGPVVVQGNWAVRAQCIVRTNPPPHTYGRAFTAPVH